MSQSFIMTSGWRRHLYYLITLAEAVRFELTDPDGSAVFKTAAINHSATLPV